MHRLGIRMLLLWATSAASVVATAQEAPREPAVFRGRLDVNLVTVHVTVLGRDGRPVTGLEASDFTVFEDGVPRSVDYFEAVEPVGVGQGAGEDRPQAPARAITPVSAAARGDGVAVVFDNADLERRGRARVLDALRDLVPEHGPPATPTMVATVGDRFEVVTPFVTDGSALRAAYARVEASPTGGEARKTRRRMLLRDIFSGSPVRGRTRTAASGVALAEAQRLRFRIEAFREEDLIRMERTLDLLDAVVRSLSARSGRTALVWVTEDLSLRPALDVYRRFWDRYQVFDSSLTAPDFWGFERDLTGALEQLIARAQASGVTIHVVDASDRDREVSDVDFGSGDVASETAMQGAGRAATAGYDFTAVRDAMEGGQTLGYGSGGDFYGGTRDFRPFVEHLEAVTTRYYVLGYERPSQGDGARHALRIDVVGRPGVTVRHPEHVLDRTPDMRLEDRAVAVALWGGGEEPTTVVDLELFDEPRTSGDGSRRLPLELRVPTAWLVAAADGRAPVTAVLVSVHADGRVSAPAVVRLAVDADMLDDPSAVATARLELAASPDAVRVGVAVRDDTSGAVGVGGAAVD